jgi:hypothetical protein
MMDTDYTDFQESLSYYLNTEVNAESVKHFH